jgi:cardiolipin synthase A/B
LTTWLLYALAAVGAFAIVSVVITLFSALGRRPAHLQTTAEPPPVTSEDFLAALAGSVNGSVRKGGSARLLDNGVGFIPALLDDIARAEHTINFMVYIWEGGEMAVRIAQALAARAREGIEVRVLLDGLGALGVPAEIVQTMRDAGVRIKRFRPPRIGRLTRFHKRNHRRAIVFDGRIGYTGGAAVGDKWLGDAETPDHWRDVMVRATGCMAESLQSAFAELWAHCSGELLVGPHFYPSTADGHAHEDHAGEPPRHIALTSSPSSEEHPVRLFFNLTILAARERLWITMPYFVPDRGTIDNLKARALAGVDVRLLLPNEFTDARPIRWAAHGFYAELLEAGLRIWEYQPTMLHTKAMVVDGAWSVVGSANLDIRSKELNQENLLGILDTTFAAELDRAFRTDLERSKEIRRDEWKRRGVLARSLERAAAVFSEQY